MNFINGLQKCAISKDTQNKIPMIADTPSKMTEKKISKNHQMKSYQIKLTIFSNYIWLWIFLNVCVICKLDVIFLYWVTTKQIVLVLN